MALPSDPIQLKTGFFHSGPQRSFHRDGQAVYESNYPSLGVVKSDYVITPATPLPYSATEILLDAWIVANPGILRKYMNYVLTPDALSNQELYYINDVPNGGRQKPIIQEQLMVDPSTNQPANAYVVKLYQGVGGSSPGTQIGPTAGRWWVSPDEGFFHFEVGFTPVNMGWGAVTATCYIYIGDTVATGGGGGGTGLAILVGEGPPHLVTATGSPQLYVDTIDYTGNPLQFKMWAWVNGVTRERGWRPVSCDWFMLYHPDIVQAVEIYVSDVVAGKINTTQAVEIMVPAFTKNKTEIVRTSESVLFDRVKYPIDTVQVSEFVSFLITPSVSSVLNESPINTYALNG